VFAQSGELGGWLKTEPHQPEKKTVEVDLPLRAPFLQSGIVRDTAGQPLEGAKVWIRRVIVGAVTGPDGTYVIPFLDDANPLLVEREGFGSVALNPLMNHDVTLPARGQFHIRVESAGGTPVIGATVWCEAKVGHSRISLGDITDEMGRVTIDALPAPSGITISGSKKIDDIHMVARQELKLIAAETGEVVLTLEPYASRPTSHISGRVIMADTGEPVQATIFIGPQKEYVRQRAGHTEADGTFRVSALELRDWLVWFAPDDVTLRPKSGWLEKAYLSEGEPEEGLVVEMERGAAIRGHVVSADGVPFAGGYINVTQDLPNGEQPIPGYIRGMFADSQGNFVLESLKVTGYPLKLKFRGQAVRVEPLVVGEITDNVEIVVENLILAEAEKPMYSGRLVDEQGNPIAGAMIQAKPLQTTVADATGQFGFRYDYKRKSVMSVHIDGEVAIEAIRVPTEAREGLGGGGPREGAKVSYSVTEAGQILGQVTVSPEKGQNSNDPADPVPGAVVRLTSDVDWKQNAYTRADGSFEFSTEKDGTVEFSVRNAVTHYTPLLINSSGGPITLVEGRDLFLKANAPPTIRLVARRAKLNVVLGTIRDESGALLDADVTYYFRDISGGSLGSQGRFFWGGQHISARPQTSDEPFLMLVRKGGYQPVLLERGRDFELGDRNVQVVLKRGPFPEGESVFTAVTGYSEERGVGFPGRSFKGEARQWASTASIQQNVLRTFRLHALLPDGQPAKTLFTAKATSLNQGRPSPEITAATMLLQDSAAIERLSGSDGWFTWPKTRPSWNTGVIWVWAKGTARHLFSYDQNTPDGETFEIALARPASLTIRVATYERKPAQGFLIMPAGTYAYSHDELYGAPTTDVDGVFRRDNLPPGQYDYWVYRPRSEDQSVQQKLSPQFISFDLTAGSDSEAKVVHGIPRPGSAEELLSQFSRKRRNTQSEKEEAPAIDPGAHNRLAALVSKKLKALPGRYTWEVRESQRLISAARHFKLDGAVPALRLYFKQWPGKSIGHSVLYEPYELADTIAELAGNDATQFFANAAVSDLAWNQRTAAIMALGAIGTAESVAEFARLRDAAYGTAGAPARLESPSDAETIAQSIEMTFNVLPLAESEREGERVMTHPNSIRIIDDGTARVMVNLPSGGGTVIHVKRLHGEWVAVGVGSTYMSSRSDRID
jgi:hypothetical protein